MKSAHLKKSILENSADSDVRPDPTVDLLEPRYDLVTEMISEWVNTTPNGIAISSAERAWTYLELGSSADRIALQIQNLGPTNRRVIAVTGDPSFGLISCMLAIMKSGAILLSIDPKLPEKRRTVILEEAKATLILATRKSAVPEAWRNQEKYSIVEVAPEDASIKLIPEHWKGISIDQGGDDAAYIFFTSGTTGKPKGILGSALGLAHFLNWERGILNAAPGDRAAQLTGLSFDVVLRDIFLALVSGATLCLPDVDLSGDKVLAWLEEQKITLLHSVPTLAESWLPFRPPNVHLENLRCICFAGEPLKEILVERWRTSFNESTQIFNFYGPTETTLAKFFYLVPQKPSKGIQPVGWPQPSTQAIILNQDQKLCAIGEPGEIVIRTPFMSHGYINVEGDQNKVFFNNPFSRNQNDWCYRTGDMGKYRTDGAVEIIGRLDHQVKIFGQRVELGEVEVSLLQHPKLQQVTVMAYKAPSGNYQLAAFIVLKKGEQLNKETLREFLEKELPPHMIPSQMIFLPNLPLTTNGKVDRETLSKKIISEPGKVIRIEDLPKTETQRKLAEIWQELLNSRVGRGDHFLKIGGDSLLVLKMSSMIRQTFLLEIHANSIFQFPILEQLAGLIDRENQKSSNIKKSFLDKQKIDSEMPITYSQDLHLSLEPNISRPRRRTSRILIIDQKLDYRILENCFLELVEKNPILRTTFNTKNGSIAQTVREVPSQILTRQQTADVNQKDSETVDDLLSRFRNDLVEINTETFNLQSGPVFKVKIFSTNHDKHLLLILASHLVCDLISMDFIVDELNKSYSHRIAQEKLARDDNASIEYYHFASWQKKVELESEYLKKENYWKGQELTNNFNLDSNITKMPNVFVNKSLEIANSELAGLQEFCRSEGVTLFNVFFTLFGEQLLKHFGRESILVGMVHSGRFHAEFNDLIGSFATSLPIRIHQRKTSFRAQIQDVREEIMNANSNQYYPVHKLIKKRIQIAFNQFAKPSVPLDRGLNVTKSSSLDEMFGDAPVDGINVVLNVRPTKDGVKIVLVANSNFISMQAAENFMNDYRESLLLLNSGVV